jgi:hypothetical protein
VKICGKNGILASGKTVHKISDSYHSVQWFDRYKYCNGKDSYGKEGL